MFPDLIKLLQIQNIPLIAEWIIENIFMMAVHSKSTEYQDLRLMQMLSVKNRASLIFFLRKCIVSVLVVQYYKSILCFDILN